MVDIVKNIEEIRYNSQFWWNRSINPLATKESCLPDCTCCVVGAIKKANLPDICDRYGNAGEYHLHLINGWYRLPFEDNKANIKVGDVIEWEKGNHIAIVSDIRDGVPWVSGSFYTGDDGKAYSGDGYSKRSMTNLKDIDEFFYKNYPYRYFHFVPLEEEMKWCGGTPEHLLVSPNSVVPVERDISKKQIYVGVTGLRVRTEPNTECSVRGVASVGYYNVSEIVKGGSFENGDTWYKVDDFYLAGVNGVIYYPNEEIAPLEEMMALMKKMQDNYIRVCKERDEYKRRLNDIRGLTE